jgi:hypothetical protein
MSILDIDLSTADTIISNLYTEEDRKRAEIQDKRSQMDSSVGDTVELHLAKDEFINPEVTRYQRNAAAMINSEVPSTTEKAETRVRKLNGLPELPKDHRELGEG